MGKNSVAPSIVDKSDDTFHDSTYISFQSFSFPQRKTREKELEKETKERKK